MQFSPLKKRLAAPQRFCVLISPFVEEICFRNRDVQSYALLGAPQNRTLIQTSKNNNRSPKIARTAQARFACHPIKKLKAMVSFGLLVGAALAGVYNWASGVYSYNRDAWMTDIQVEQAHVYQEDNLQIQLKAMQREEVRDLVNSDINMINNSLLVATLILSLSGEMLFEGQIPTDCPAFVLNAYMLCLGSAVFHLSFTILFGICASSKAYRRASRLLTRFIRPQWKEHFQKMSRRKATENTATFESRPLSRMMMPPLASRMFGGRRPPQDDERSEGKASPTFTATWSNHTETSEGFFSPQPNRRSRWGGQSRSLGSYLIDESDKEEDVEAKEPKFDSKSVDWHKHLSLWKDTSQSWVKFSSCMFKCLARGTMNLLEACGYLAVGTLYSGYADAWAFWAIQILFTVINIMIVDFLLRSFEPSNIKSDWLIWVLRRHPFIVACIVASGPLFCVIAAATSWVVMDRFLIPLCYGTHTLVNIYFVSMFTTDEEVQERHHDSDSENEQEGIEAVQAGWGPWAAQPMPRNSSSKEDFFPVQMLRQGTMVVNFLWSCAFLWALYGAWFGMDFKNSKAAVQSWRDPLPLLDVSGETMASPSPFWKPHALVCPRKQVFVADRYHVYELKNNNTKVERYPCLINGTIADVAAACDEKSCWPVVLLQGVPPLVLDCSTGRQDPLLQTTADAGRIATDADNEHKLQTLVATMGDKMIVQYGWSVQREAWEPLWDIENTVGVLAMDLISDRLLVFHEGGYVQAQDMQTGRLCSTWAFDSKDAVIGGGCGNKKYKTILILVKKGHGTTLMRAELPGLDECTGKANRPAVSLIAWRSSMVPWLAHLWQPFVKYQWKYVGCGFPKASWKLARVSEPSKNPKDSKECGWFDLEFEMW